jgi:hypothetical protein
MLSEASAGRVLTGCIKVTTALFSTCGLGFRSFMAGAILSLPKQFMLVVIGVLSEDAGDG